MAVTIPEVVVSAATVLTTATLTFATTPVAGDVFVIALGSTTVTKTITGISGLGATWTRVFGTNVDDSTVSANVSIMVGTGATSSGVVTVSMSAAAGQLRGFLVRGTTGDARPAIGTAAGSGTSTTSPTLNHNQIVIGIAAVSSAGTVTIPSATTPSSGWVWGTSGVYATVPVTVNSGYYIPSGATNHSFTLTNTTSTNSRAVVLGIGGFTPAVVDEAYVEALTIPTVTPSQLDEAYVEVLTIPTATPGQLDEAYVEALTSLPAVYSPSQTTFQSVSFLLDTAITLTSYPRANATLIYTHYATTAATTIQSITGCGAAWAQVSRTQTSSGVTEVWVGAGCTGFGNTVTVGAADTTTIAFVCNISEWVGLTGAFGAPVSASSSSGTAVDSGTVIPATAGDLVLSMMADGNSGTVVANVDTPSAFTSLTTSNVNVYRELSAYLVTGGTSAAKRTWTKGTAGFWIATGVSFPAGLFVASPRVRQATVGYNTGITATSQTVTFSETPRTGDVLVVTAAEIGATTISGVSGCGATWVKAGGFSDASMTTDTWIGTGATASGVATVTLSPAAGATLRGHHIAGTTATTSWAYTQDSLNSVLVGPAATVAAGQIAIDSAFQSSVMAMFSAYAPATGWVDQRQANSRSNTTYRIPAASATHNVTTPANATNAKRVAQLVLGDSVFATLSGIVALTAASTLTAAGVVSQLGVAALSASSSLTAGAAVTDVAGAVLAATSTLTAGAAVTDVAGAVLAATSTLTAAATDTVASAVALTATTGLTTAYTFDGGAPGDANTALGLDGGTAGGPLTGPAFDGGTPFTSTTGQPYVVVVEAAALVATTVLGVTGIDTVQAAVVLSASSSLSAASTASTSGAASLVASTSLAVSGQVAVQASTALVATSALAVSGVDVVPAAASLVSSTTLAASGALTELAAASMVATSSLVVAPLVTTQAAAALSAVSGLTVAATATVPAVSTLVASATLATSAVVTEPAAVALTAVSSLSAAATVVVVQRVGSAALVAASTLSTTANLALQGAAALVASTALASSAVDAALAQGALLASSSLTVDGFLQVPAEVILAAGSGLTTDGLVEQFGSVVLQASTTLSTDTTLLVLVAVQLDAVTALGLDATVIHPVMGAAELVATTVLGLTPMVLVGRDITIIVGVPTLNDLQLFVPVFSPLFLDAPADNPLTVGAAIL